MLRTLFGKLADDDTSILGKPLVTSEEVARKFGVSPRTAESPAFARRLGLARIKINRLTRFDPDEVDAAIQRARIAGDGGSE